MPTINGRACVANGINLLQGTGTASGDVSDGVGILVNGAFNGYDAVKTSAAWIGRFINLQSALGRTNAKAGDWYTISVYVKADKQIDTGSLGLYRAIGTNYSLNLHAISMQNKPITTQWQQYSWSFQIDDNSLKKTNTRVEYDKDTGDNWIYWAGWKLEKGSVATPLTPAPVDKVFSDGVQVYGRNLFSVRDWNAKPLLWSHDAQYMNIQLEPNTEYTLTTNINRTDGVFDIFLFKDDEDVSSATNGVNIGSGRTLTTSSTGNVKVGVRNRSLSDGTSWIKLEKGGSWIKLENGATASPWTPAPEDVM